MVDEVLCPACGAPLNDPGVGDVILCDSCGTQVRREYLEGTGEPDLLTVEPVEENLEEVLAAEEETLEPLEPAAYAEPQGAQIFDTTPESGNVVETPPVTTNPRQMNPLVIVAIILGVLVLCACIAVAVIVLGVIPWFTTSGLAPLYWLT